MAFSKIKKELPALDTDPLQVEETKYEKKSHSDVGVKIIQGSKD